MPVAGAVSARDEALDDVRERDLAVTRPVLDREQRSKHEVHPRGRPVAVVEFERDLLDHRARKLIRARQDAKHLGDGRGAFAQDP